jgi:hypothetical protein
MAAKVPPAIRLVFVRTFGTGYTAEMRRLIVALVFIAIGVWLGFSLVPEVVANTLLGTP